jgi:hypothetical protein
MTQNTEKMVAVGLDPNDPRVQKAIDHLVYYLGLSYEDAYQMMHLMIHLFIPREETIKFITYLKY